MKNIYLRIIYVLAFLGAFTVIANAQTTITIGTQGTTIGSASNHPYAAYYTTSRVQFLVTAAEINAAGINAASYINSIGFNVSATYSGSGSCTSGSVSNGQVANYKIAMKNTTQGLPLSAYDYTGLTDCYTIALWEPISGWNTHVFNNAFQWDGSSNILVDICSANVGTTCSVYCYVSNATVYGTATVQNSIVSGWADSQGSWCGSSFPNACSYTPSGSATNVRPDFRLTFQPLAAPVPPTPNFQFTLGVDTLWEKVTSTLLNTSSGATKSYWNVTQYCATSPTGPWSNYSTLPKDTLQCNPWGCFIDTANNNPNLNYFFPTRGYYKVNLTAVNPYGSNFIEKIVFVDTPAVKPTAQFFATRRQLGANDRIKINNLSLNAPARVKWWTVNSCSNCVGDTNRFLPNDSAFSPVFAAYSPGTYTVCVSVSNSKGADTLCRKDYMKVLPGYLMTHIEPGRFDSVARDDQGYLYSDLRTSAGVNMAGSFQPTSNVIGFRIAPCADTIYLTLERMRMRATGNAGGDSIYVRLNGYTGPIVRRWGGNNLNAINDTLKVYKFAGQQLFVTYTPAVTTPLVSLVSDSGFTLRWSSSPAQYNKPIAGFTCPDTLYSGYKVKFLNASIGQRSAYAWDLNGDGVFGQDKPSVSIDSVTYSPTITFFTNSPTTRKVCLKTANCVGNDTFCKVMPLLPFVSAPVANFIASRSLGFISDTFQFIDRTQFGALSWKWRFDPNNVTYLNGTDSTSQFPYISLNAAQSYNVTLIATNPIGSSTVTKNSIVSAIDYGSPGSAFPAVLDATDFGISRVRINGADKLLDTITALKSPTYTRLFNTLTTTMYRGGKYKIEVYRNTANDAMTLRTWADFNRDADYLDANETVYAEDLAKKVKTEFFLTVPNDAQIGASRILIGACNNISTISSTTANVGVYEDYGMFIGNDVVKPVITLNGAANTVAELNKTFVDPYATAIDNIQGDVSSSIQTISNLDLTHLGAYTIKYFVTDYYGNTSDTLVRNVVVVLNSTGPTLTLLGSDTVYVEVFSQYVEPGYTAKDNLGADITGNVQRIGLLNSNVLGTTVFTYKITDAYGLTATKIRVVKVRDTQAPVVKTYSGKDVVVHQIGTAFDDIRYVQVTDNYWTDLMPNRILGTINTNQVGSYLLTYQNADGSGNISAPYTITVEVKNTIMPTITLVGSSVVTIPVFSTYNDLGVVGRDYKNDILPYSSNLNSVLHTDVIGDTIVTYSVSDEFGNTVYAQRTIRVRDLESPVIELLGSNPFILPLCNKYSDPGVKVTDNFNGGTIATYSQTINGLTITIDSSKVNTCGAGFYYTVFINATDAAGNKAEEKKRVVYVTFTGLDDLTKPNGFNIYPNPAVNELNIELKEGELRTVSVYDIQGKAIELIPVKSGKNYQFDISKLTSGLYMIKIETKEGNILSGKFTVIGK